MIIEDKNFISQGLKDQIQMYLDQTYYRLLPWNVDPAHASPFFVADKMALIDEHETEWIDILDAFWNKHFNQDVDPDKIETLRINNTFPNGQVKCLPHRDHSGDYYNFLLCLNEPLDDTSATVVIGEKGNIQRVCYPEQWKALVFKNRTHFHYYPKVGHRTMMVATIYE